MTFAQFYIGLIFYTATGAWRVTDKGTRTVVAVHLENIPEGEQLTGPPYYYSEEVFDEYDFEACFLKKG